MCICQTITNRLGPVDFWWRASGFYFSALSSTHTKMPIAFVLLALAPYIVIRSLPAAHRWYSVRVHRSACRLPVGSCLHRLWQFILFVVVGECSARPVALCVGQPPHIYDPSSVRANDDGPNPNPILSVSLPASSVNDPLWWCLVAAAAAAEAAGSGRESHAI